MTSPRVPPRPVAFAAWQRLGPEVVALVLTLSLFVSPFTPLDGYDWLRMHLWHKLAYREAWLTGELVHWNPFVGLGRPAQAEIEAAFFYPPNLVFLAGPALGLVIGVWIHLVGLLRGMRRLMADLEIGEAGRWMAALTFALGAPLLGRLQSGQIQVFCTLAWMPFLLVWGGELARRMDVRSAVKLAAGFGLMVLAGSPPMGWIIGWTLAAWILARWWAKEERGSWVRLGALGVAALIGGLALAAVQLLPFGELVVQGNRGGGEIAFVLGDQMAGQSWSSLWRSRLPDRFFYWEYNLYGGVIALALAISTLFIRRREARAWWVIGGAFTLLALGSQTPLLPVLVDLVPGFDAWRYPSRYAIITALAVAVLAGIALDQFVRWVKPSGSLAVLLGTAVVVCHGADLLRANYERQVAYGHVAPVETERQLAAFIAENLPTSAFPPRVLAPNWIVRENSGMRDGISALSGFANPALARPWAALHAAAGIDPNPGDPANLPNAIFGTDPTRFLPLGLDVAWDPAAASFTLVGGAGHRVKMANGRIEEVAFSPDRIEVMVTSDATGRLVLAEPWYPGWSAEVNGEAAEVELAQGWMRAVVVPAGPSRVVMTYRSRWLGWGAVISLAGVAALIFAWRRSQPR